MLISQTHYYLLLLIPLLPLTHIYPLFFVRARIREGKVRLGPWVPNDWRPGRGIRPALQEAL